MPIFPSQLIGRQKEFRAFYDKLYDNKLSNLLIYGEGGMGKSAIVGSFALELLRKGYKVFDLSFKSHEPLINFMQSITSSLKDKEHESITDDRAKFKKILEALSKAHDNKIVFIFDNLESIQNMDTKEIENPTIRMWIEVLKDREDIILLMTSRWKWDTCKSSIHLLSPLKSDFLHYAIRNYHTIPIEQIESAFDIFGANYEATNYFFEALKGLNKEEENEFIIKVIKAKKEAKEYIFTYMALEQILSRRTPKQIALLHRIPQYHTSIPREGIRAIALDLPKEDLDILVSFSLIEESLHYHNDKKVAQYQLSSLVYEYIKTEIVPNLKLKEKASLFQLYLLKNHRKTLTQGYIAFEALEETNLTNKLREWLFEEGELEEDKEEKKELRVKGLILNQIAIIYKRRGELPKALEYLEKSLKIQVEIGDKSGWCATKFNMGHIYLATQPMH
ncbi:MAG: AAA family ATPase [Sulfurovum sp.]|nr:AAA family ATPase [Sulfurovum sp.]